MRNILEFVQRLIGTVRRPRTDADMQEELRLHLDLAAEDARRRGLTPDDAARAARLKAGGVAQAMDTVRDQRGLPSLEALVADVRFGWRQLLRHRIASLSAILSLGLAMGATLSAFRLVDAVLLRPLPVANPSTLFVVANTFFDADGNSDIIDDYDYPTLRRYREAVGNRAELMLLGMAVRRPIQIDAGDPELAVQQFVSGNVLTAFGLQPALGRLITPNDDVRPDGHPVAAISYDFWQRRFGGNPEVLGTTFRAGNQPIEIIGVTPKGFTGTEPGLTTDFFVPSMMNPEALNAVGWSWFRIWVRPRAGATSGEVHALLQARFNADHVERAKTFTPDTPKARIDAYMSEQLLLEPAGAGISALQRSFRRPLWILATLAGLLLLIACANVANLLLARSMSRRIEMALRMSIGAARGRLVQMMLVESAMLALLACLTGALFAAWAAPFVVSMLAPAERPVRLVLDLDWRVLLAGATLTFTVTMLFGLVPALRASAVTPLGALKEMRAQGGQRRLTDTLVAAQMAFCVFLLFGASLFVGTFDRLQRKPLGFATENLIHMVAEGRTRIAPEAWKQLASELRETPRVESVAVAGWAPLSGNRWRSSVTVPGRTSPEIAPHWVSVSPEYFETMAMPIVEGRTFSPGERSPRRNEQRQPVGGVAVVNQAFARVYFDGRSPVGQRVIVDSSQAPMEIIGLVADAVYFNVRETYHPGVFVPLEARDNATIMIRTAAGADDLRPFFKRELPRIRPGLRTRSADPFEAFVIQQMIRERLLAALSGFFAVLALLLAIIGMYGVLSYAVTRERREIGLRMALGARPGHVLTLITSRLVAVVTVGTAIGMAGGFAFSRTVRTLLFEMEPSDPLSLLVPILALAAASAVASIPPAMRAIRIDPAQTIKIDG